MCEAVDSKEFRCNTLIIKALLPFLPFSERKKAQEWLTKLEDMDESGDLKIRNEYAFYLLINVQNGSMSQPFNRGPPGGKLKPLCRILPDFLYEDVMKQLKISYCRLNKMLNESTDNYEIPDLACDPSTFPNQQPRPRTGIIAHCAAFSNYEDQKNPCM